MPLDQQLVLAPFFASKIGYNSVANMLESNKNKESQAATVASILENITNCISREPNYDYISIEMLRTMDSNIREDLAHINSQRSAPISLKYFQYLAALSAEYMLIRLADSPREFANEINTYTEECQQNLPEYDLDNVAHLSKMAFWMATGSGKTLLMHLNYLQFLRHKIFTPDNIILITPNEEMSEQHLEEMRLSNIPCLRFGESSGIYDNRRQNAVLVMDIHKFTTKKKSKKGISIPPETFAGRNLAFVDEGHKGASGTAYFDIRDRLTKNGFAYEYSATFGNAIAAIGNNNRAIRTAEYARAIAFDYSYGYFHNDGYGKDYYILNMQGEIEDTQDILMLGNLLAFFQQKLAFALHNAEIQEYQIAPPLLLLLGASVVGGNPRGEDTTPQTDIIKTLAFLRRTVSDKNQQGLPWLCATVQKILSYNSGLTAESGGDLFANKFQFLSETYGDDIEKLCKEMRENIFYASSPAALKFCPIKKTSRQKNSGEIALRVSDKPFALIYVGDTAKLRTLAEDENEFGPNNILEDSIQSPLFPNINCADSPINLLIGAKKFMEGWSSWRVCGIGLLNVGQSEGPLIIQLFGRGVRLRGHNWSLKRSGRFLKHGKLKRVLSILETLNIFGINADFMSRFRNYLKNEGQVYDSISLPVQVLPRENSNDCRISEEITEAEFKNKNLLIPEMPPDDDFDKTIMLEKDDALGKIQIDLSSSASLMRTGGADAITRQQSNEIIFNQKLIDLDNLYLCMLEKYKNINHSDIIICRKKLPEVLTRCSYLYDNADGLPRGKRLQNVAFDALCQYADKQQGKSRRQWQKDNMKFSHLQSSGEKRHANFADYIVHIREDDTADIINERNLIQRIEEMLETNTGNLYLRSDNPLPSIYFSEHLYQPLLTEMMNQGAKISPPPLNDGEKQFIEKLTAYAEAQNFPDKVNKIYALRNRAKSGVGFCLQNGAMHYPDFILWVIGANRQRIVFVEPHGMGMSYNYVSEYKAQLYKYLQNISQDKLPKNPQLEIDSYIMSVTNYEYMRQKWGWDKEKFQHHHIFFIEDLTDDKNRNALFANMLGFKK